MQALLHADLDAARGSSSASVATNAPPGTDTRSRPHIRARARMCGPAPDLRLDLRHVGYSGQYEHRLARTGAPGCGARDETLHTRDPGRAAKVPMGVLRGLLRAVGGLLVGIGELLKGLLTGLARLVRRLF